MFSDSYHITMQELTNKIICGDCVKVLNDISEPFADLIFADPPFNIGYKYDKYDDNIKKEKYIEWTRQWITACKKVLKPAGSFYIAIGDDYAANVKIIADDLGLFLRNWIIWHYNFGQQTKQKFARSHTHIFYFVNDNKNYTFNDNAVRIPSDRQLIYSDRRAHSKGRIPDDVWTEFSRVCGTFKERQGWHPCQMPEFLLQRIISVSTNPGDCVLDPFSGSGTTAAAAYRLGRNFVGIEISKKYVKQSENRLEILKKQKSRNLLLNINEINEVKRLLIDMNRPAKKIVADKTLLNLFVKQLNVRLNSNRIDTNVILPILMDSKID